MAEFIHSLIVVYKISHIKYKVNMDIKSYVVTCGNCKASETIVIDRNHQIYWKQTKNIISGRRRLDGNWGWQCLCGNNDLLTKQERNRIKNLQDPDPKDIEFVMKNLVPDQPKFNMAVA